MRSIDTIVIHCSATMEGKPFTAADLDRMHRRQGWAKIGYHWVIELDGRVVQGRKEAEVGAHVAGHNARSIGVCYIGGIGLDGVADDTRTPAQLLAMRRIILELQARYPGARIVGHRDLSPDLDHDGVIEKHEWLKVCPCFDVRKWLAAEGLTSKPKGHTA